MTSTAVRLRAWLKEVGFRIRLNWHMDMSVRGDIRDDTRRQNVHFDAVEHMSVQRSRQSEQAKDKGTVPPADLSFWEDNAIRRVVRLVTWLMTPIQRAKR